MTRPKRNFRNWQLLARLISLVLTFSKEADGNLDDDNGSKKSRVVKKFPECAACDEKEGLGVELLKCPCKLVSYCSNRSQRAHWLEHKQLCKQVPGYTITY